MALAMRSLTEPVGFWPSNLASRRTDGFGLSTLTSTIGVSPTRSRMEEWTAMVLLFVEECSDSVTLGRGAPRDRAAGQSAC